MQDYLKGREMRTVIRHSKRIRKRQCLRDIKKYSFLHRTVDVWNGLSEEIVTAASVQTFKEMLDIYSMRGKC